MYIASHQGDEDDYGIFQALKRPFLSGCFNANVTYCCAISEKGDPTFEPIIKSFILVPVEILLRVS